MAFWALTYVLHLQIVSPYHSEQKWHGSDKNWNGSNSFCKETVNFYPFRNGSIGAYGPDTEWIKLPCFFAKTIGTVPVFVGSVPFLLCRVNASLITGHLLRLLLFAYINSPPRLHQRKQLLRMRCFTSSSYQKLFIRGYRRLRMVPIINNYSPEWG